MNLYMDKYLKYKQTKIIISNYFEKFVNKNIETFLKNDHELKQMMN